MTISISVRSFARCERADMTVSKVALLAGPNENGKTSACLAAAAALTGQTVPIDGIKKASAGALVRTGDAEASVRVKSEQGEVTVAWPSAARETTGTPPEASIYAAGLASLVDLDDKAKQKALAGYIDAVPSREDLTAALKDDGLPLQLIDRVWQKIAESDWDAAWSYSKESGKKLKGAWEEITAQNFGTDKMKTWLPVNWTEDLAGESLDKLEAAVVHAKRAVEEAIAGAAVDAATIDRLRTAAAGLDALELKAHETQKAADAAKKAVADAEAKRNALPPATADASMKCPHCEKPVTMKPKKPGVWEIAKAETELSPDELQKRRTAIAEADGALANARDTSTKAENAAREADAAAKAARRAGDELRDAEAKTGDAGAVEKAREFLRKTEERRAAFVAKTNADAKALAITQNLAIQAALAPDGLRKKVLGKALDAFNERLAALSEAAKWKAVTIDADLSVKYGGRPYMRVWESQAYRVRATLAVAMAQIDKSAMVILDAAGVLDVKGRNGLIDMLRAAQVPALIAMTFNTPKTVPNLATLDYGESYWISQGVVTRLDDVMVKEAEQRAA